MGIGRSNKSSTNQIEVVKDDRGFVHLPKNKQHLIVNELFVLFQVAVHLLLQHITNLRKNTHGYWLGLNKSDQQEVSRDALLDPVSPVTTYDRILRRRACCDTFYALFAFPADLFGGDIFKVLAHHDTPEFGFD